MKAWRTVKLLSIALVSAAFLTQPVHGQENELPEIIRRVIDASDSIRYSGVRRVELKLGPDRIRYVEYIQKDRRRTRVEFPEDGSYRGQIIVENERERRHYFPEKNLIEVLPPRREAVISQMTRLFTKNRGRRFQVVVADGSAVAGVSTTRIVTISSEGKTFQKIWVDPQTYLILKRETYGRQGQVMGTAEFTKVDYRPRFTRDAFALNVKGAKVVTPRNKLDDLVAQGGFQKVSLSPKDPYKLESCRIQRIADQPTLVQNYVNNNGRFTLFQFRGSVDGDRLQKFGRGDFNSHSWQSNGASFVLLGDLPLDVLRQIAQRLSD